MAYNSDYEIRLAQLEAMGGDTTKHYDSVYDIDLEILRLTEEGGGSYVAGSGITISGDTISVDTDTIQEKLIAGSGVTISGNTISAAIPDMSEYEKKADYTLSYKMPESGYIPEIDYTAIDDVTTDGVYTLDIISDMITGSDEYVGFGKMSVINAGQIGVVQSISIICNLEATKEFQITRMFTGSSWIENSFVSAVIDDAQQEYQTLPWSTYSATKINQLLSAKQNTLTAGANITISGNTISATDTTYQAGSGITISGNTISATGGDAIEDVQTLPDASENKDKLFRLDNGDKDVYAAKLLSSETITTNRLPDEQQIDKAYLYLNNDEPFYYKSDWKIICTDGEINGYGWLETYPDSDEWYLGFTQDDATNVTPQTKCYFFGIDVVESVDLENHTITINGPIIDWSWDEAGTLSENDIFPIPATYNAPEANQIGNAYLNHNTGEDEPYYYTGIQKTIVCSDGSLNLYQWGDNKDEYFYFTEKQASELYLISDVDEGVIYTDFNVAYITLEDGWEVSGNTYTNLNMSTEDIWDTVNSYGINPIYIPQLNAPDSEQVDNAYIYDITGQHKYYYKGLESLVCTDGTINAPHWIMEGTDGTQENNSLFTTPTANSLYKTTYEDAFGVLNYSPNYSGQDYTIFYDTTNNVWKSTRNRESTEEMLTDDGSAESLFDDGVNISTVKYQRTETTEEWGWQPLTDNATNEDIDAMFESSSPVVKRVLMKRGSLDEETQEPKYPLSLGEGLVNENDETMEWDGDTYYKWVLYEEDEGVSSIDYSCMGEQMIYLTTTLNPTLPFDRNSSECAYVITDGEDDYNGGSKVYLKIALIHEDGSITYEE